jgi:hypothetical protein
MLALQEWREARCRGCGGDLAETTDPDREDGYRPLLPVRCHRCTALSRSEETYRKADAPHPHALIHRVELKPSRG